MKVRNILAVIGGATVVAAVVVAGAAVVFLKKTADAIPDDMLEDAEPLDAEEIAEDLHSKSDGTVRRTPLSPPTT